MVRVAVLEQHVELPAARLLYARCRVLQNRGFEFLVFGRHDVEFDRIDVWHRHRRSSSVTGLARRSLASTVCTLALSRTELDRFAATGDVPLFVEH